MDDSLIAPDQHWALWAVLLGAAAVGVWAERTRWGAKLSGAVITIFCTFVLSNLGVVPVQAPAYDVVWSFFVPLAIPLLLFQADLRRIVRESAPTLIAFGLGAVGTVVGTVLAFQVIELGPEGTKLAAIFCATYIGGSMNYAAAAEATGLQSGDLLTAGIAADNLVMTLYFLVLFALPSFPALRRLYVQRVEAEAPSAATSGSSRAGRKGQGEPLRLPGMLLALGLSACFCAV
ncbi:MAG: DUF819 family protein, partial [Deltaproteobacteria bacterium]|nr:DUF819 family protein [Deltaproteobacteria bacterium]MBW2537555.1 DUF819 family protein [Deltaproteobacteria bacterium]